MSSDQQVADVGGSQSTRYKPPFNPFKCAQQLKAHGQFGRKLSVETKVGNILKKKH